MSTDPKDPTPSYELPKDATQALLLYMDKEEVKNDAEDIMHTLLSLWDNFQRPLREPVAAYFNITIWPIEDDSD